MMKSLWAFTAFLLVVGCGAPRADSDAARVTSGVSREASATPKFSDVVVTDADDSKEAKAILAANTPKVFVNFHFDNVKSGSKIKGAWVADKAQGAPDNTKIDEATLDIGPIVNSGTFSMSKPTKGWPVGQYHVDLSVDGKILESPKFSIANQLLSKL